MTSPDGRAGESKVRGRAVLEEGPALNESVAAAIANQKDYIPVPGKFHLFRVDIEDITFVRWGDDNDQYLTRWPPGVEQLRAGPLLRATRHPGRAQSFSSRIRRPATRFGLACSDAVF